MRRAYTRRRWLGLLLMLCLGAGLTTRAAAQDAPTVAITVYIIEASNEPGGVDPEVRHIHKRMGKAFTYSRFRLMSKRKVTVPVGGQETLDVPGQRTMVVRPKSIEDERLNVAVAIRKPKKKDGSPTRVTGKLKSGGTFIVGGYEHGPGQLVFAISADF